MLSLSMRPALRQRVEQRIELMLKQELRLELRLLLKQILALLQTLRLEQKMTLETVQGVAEAIRTVPEADLYGFAHEVVRKGGFNQAAELSYVLQAVAIAAPDEFEHTGSLAERLDEILRAEADRREHRERKVRAARPVLALRLVLRAPRFFGGRGGERKDLADLLTAMPQMFGGEDLHWVLGGGWAVELLTEVERDHHDIDTVLMTKKPQFLDTDVVSPEDYFGVISCTSRFIGLHCTTDLSCTIDGRAFYVTMLRPEFLFCSKFLRPPRPQDWADVQTLVRKFGAKFDLQLVRKLISRNSCGWTGAESRRLMAILRTRDVDQIIERLSTFRD